MKFGSGYLYFFVLERSWGYSALLAVVAYTVVICGCAVLALGVSINNSNEEYELDNGEDVAAQWKLSMRFASAHVVSMGFGTVLPASDEAYLLAIMQQFVGLLLNIFVFTAVVAKFQKPEADIVWSRKVIIANRDEKPTVLIRVGNLRCHTLYNPCIRLTALRQHVTKEGERFMQKQSLEVYDPATISGVHTISHTIDEASPLYTLFYEDEQSAKPKLMLHVSFTAMDPVYGTELCSNTKYSSDAIFYDHRFADVIKVNERGQPQIFWSAFDEVVPIGMEDPDLTESDEGEDGRDDVQHFNVQQEAALHRFPAPTAPVGLPSPGVPRISSLASRASYGRGDPLDGLSQRGPMLPICAYALKLALTLEEAHLPYELVDIDKDNKPEWYKAVVPSGETPAMHGSLSGDASDGWEAGSEVLLQSLADHFPGVAAMVQQAGGTTAKEIDAVTDRAKLGMFAGLLAKSTAKSAEGFKAAIMEKLGLKSDDEALKDP